MRSWNQPWRSAIVTASLLLIGSALVTPGGEPGSGRRPAHQHDHRHAVGGPPVKQTPSWRGGALRSRAALARPTKGIRCDRASNPEEVQGKVPLADYASGRAAEGYWCNVRMISNVGRSGGYRVERYVDRAGNECAFWDSTLLWPHDTVNQGAEGPGVYVMDMSDPDAPVHTATLRTPAMQSPHESLRLNAKRGLLVAVMGYPTWNPGFIDVYDVSEDCRRPILRSSSPMGVIGHEGGFAPDGNTYYATGLYGRTLTAVDLSNPAAPVLLWASADYQPHGVSVSNDGRRLYMAEAAFDDRSDFSGLTILDVSEVQDRKPAPSVKLISRLTWPQISTPQNATPFTLRGHKYLLQTDEFGSGDQIGAARIIDIEDERKPFVVSHLRLSVNQGEQTEDPGDDQPFQGYQAHYCTLPSRVDPYIVACTFIMSGLRVFDIRDPARPREVAYFNKPLVPGGSVYPNKAGAFAMAAPAYDHSSRDIWYSDGHTGFFVVRLSRSTGITSFARRVVYPGN